MGIFVNKYKVFKLFWKSAPCIKTMIFDQVLDCWSSILLVFKVAATDTRSFGRRKKKDFSSQKSFWPDIISSLQGRTLNFSRIGYLF